MDRFKTIALGIAAGLSCLAGPRVVWAQANPAAPPSVTEIGGLVDVYYDFYSTKASGDAPYRNFDTKHNQFALSMAEVWFAKAPTTDSRTGFKLRLNFGPASSNFIHASEPGGTALQNIQEAYASYLAPAGKGLQIDAGIFVTPACAEVIEAKDNLNYSRGLLFVLALPAYHSGVRLTYSPSDKVTLMGGLVNGWSNVVENNTGKTMLGSVTLKPTGGVTLVENYIAGPETAGTNDNWRNLSDAILTFTSTPRLSFVANYDYASQADAHWQGIGATTNVVQKIKDVTATLELKAADNLLWRIEYRADLSDKAVFTDDTGVLHKRQHSISLAVLYSFAAKVQ
jgi:hypothetical protein